MDDWTTAPVDGKLKLTLGFLEKLVREPHRINSADAEVLLSAGLTRQGIDDAIYVCFVFSVMVRLADAFDFRLPSSQARELDALIAYRIGYSGISIPG